MEIYKNLNGNSGVAAYTITSDSITVFFTSGGRYLYDDNAPGQADVESMKALAIAGRGLGAFINQHVKKRYAAKLA